MPAFALKIPKKNASKLIVFLKEKDFLEKKYSVLRENEFVFFPVKTLSFKEKQTVKKRFSAVMVKRHFKKLKKSKQSMRQFLSKKLSIKELSALQTSFDSLGNIAIIEIPKELQKKEKLIGNSLLELNKSIKTVCKKTAAHSGEFRVEPVKIIAGKKSLFATYRESGCIFKISLGKVFFSPRLSTERLRIARQIKKDEVIGALFAGVGPFPIVFAKNSKMKNAFAVELNPVAVKNMNENIKLNKVEQKVTSILGDVRRVVPKKLKGKCDRVVMPLPKGGETFLKDAIMCIKPTGGIIHFYDFVSKQNPFDETLKKIRTAISNSGKKCRILRKKRVRDFSASTVQIVVDFKISGLHNLKSPSKVDFFG